MGRVEGKVALVPGGRRGLGEAYAVLLAGEGANVSITDRKSDEAHAVLSRLSAAGGKAIFIPQDIAKEHDRKHMIEFVTAWRSPWARPSRRTRSKQGILNHPRHARFPCPSSTRSFTRR